MLGPEANHYVTVSHPQNFLWREGSFGDLIPLLGDGLLTIDGGYHDRARRIMMPAFHREQIEASVATMTAEADRGAGERLRPGEVVDVYDWARNLAMRIAMRALLGLDPDDAGRGAAAAQHFERALAFYGTEYHLRLLRGPRLALAAAAWPRAGCSTRSSTARSPRRRRDPDPGRLDVLSLLIDGHATRTASRLSDDEVRDQVMTLMFAGHDTSTSTLSFLFYELAAPPRGARAAAGRAGRGRSAARPPTAAQLVRRAARISTWSSTRRCASTRRRGSGRAGRCASSSSPATRAGRRATSTTARGPATACPRSSRTRRRSSPSASPASARRRCPAAPTCPFGGGSRICIGKRFGQTEVKLVATMALARLRFERLPGRTMTIRQMPTLSPDGGLRMRVRERELPASLR